MELEKEGELVKIRRTLSVLSALFLCSNMAVTALANETASMSDEVHEASATAVSTVSDETEPTNDNGAQDETSVQDATVIKSEDQSDSVGESPDTMNDSDNEDEKSIDVADEEIAVTVSGILPEDAEATVEKQDPVIEQKLEDMIKEQDPNFVVYAVYDVSVISNEENWEPDDTLQLTFEGVENLDNLVVYHMEDYDGTNMQKVETNITEETVSITADHLSPFVFGGTSYDTSNPDSSVTDLGTYGNSDLSANIVYYWYENQGLLVIDAGSQNGVITGTLLSILGKDQCNAIEHIVVTCEDSGSITLKGAVFVQLENVKTIRFETGISFGTNSSDKTSASAMFAGCTSLTEVVAAESITLPNDISELFKNCTALTSIPAFDYSEVQTADEAFYNTNIQTLDLSTLDNTSVTQENMLYHTQKLTQITFGNAGVATDAAFTDNWTDIYPFTNSSIIKSGKKWASDGCANMTLYRLSTPDRYNEAITLDLLPMWTYAGAPSLQLAIDIGYCNADGLAMGGPLYCLNWQLDEPEDTIYRCVTNHDSGDIATFEQYLDDGCPAEDPYDTLVRTLYYGYPNDGSGLVYESAAADAAKKVYADTDGALKTDKLTTSEEEELTNFGQRLYWATQASIWHLLSSTTSHSVITLPQALRQLGLTDETSEDYQITLALAETIVSKQANDYDTDVSYTVPYSINLQVSADETRQAMVAGGYSLSINKVDPLGNAVEGATLILGSLNTSTNEVESAHTFTTTGKTYVINGIVDAQSNDYSIYEQGVPDGYVISDTKLVDANKKIYLTDAQIPDVLYTYPNRIKTPQGYPMAITTTVVNEYATHSVFVNKIDDSNSKAYVTGAKLTLTGTDILGNSVSQTITTTNEKTEFTGLYPGTYTITETSTPEGYETASPINVVITLTNPAKDSANYTYTMVDAITPDTGSVTFIKYDVKGNILAGASLKLTNSSGAVIATWTSTTTSHTISGLEIGETYILTETAAPSGYEIASSKTFTVSSTTGTVISLTDGYSEHSLVVKKVDQDGNRVANAVLKITGTTLTGDTISAISFTTGSNEDKTINLYPGTYKITETTTPSGYETAEDKTITIAPADGTVTVSVVDKKKTTTTDTSTSSEESENAGTITINKYVYGTSTPVIGAVLAIYSGSTEIARFTTDSTPYVITSLGLGTTYILKEISVPEGYEQAEDIEFTVTSDDQTITMYDALVPENIVELAGIKASQTGDSAPIELMIVLALISGLGIIGIMLIYLTKKKKHR